MSKYKLIPVEPTPEMIDAASEAYMPFGDMDIALRMAILAAPDVQVEPVAYILDNDIYFEGGGDINDYIRSNGQPLYTDPQPAQ